MRWLHDLVTVLGTSGARANAFRSLADEREVATDLDRFLAGFHHPAGRDRVPGEAPVGGRTRVA